MNVAHVVPHSEYVQEPKNHHHHHHDIEDLFDLTVHRDVGVREPKQHGDNDEREDNCNE